MRNTHNGYVWVGVGLFFIALYYVVVVSSSLNIPFADDLSMLASQYDLGKATTRSDQVKILFSFHNEHRLVLPRLLTVGLAKLNGNVIDFRWWIWVGNGLLLLILSILYRVFAGYRKPLVFFLPVVLLLFQPLHTELTYWGMASLQNIGVLTLAATALYVMTGAGHTNSRLGAVALLTGSAMLTGGNGLLLILSVALGLLALRHYKLLIGWLIVGGIAVSFYWRGYAIDPGSGAVKTAPTLFDSALTFLGLMGSFIESQRFEFISVSIGLIFLVVFGSVVLRNVANVWGSQKPPIGRRVQFLLAFSSFLLLTISAIAVSRYLDAALHVSRYKIYPVLLLICLYLLCLDRLSRSKWPIWIIIPACLLFNGVAYKRSLPVLAAHRTTLIGQLYNWQRYRRIDAPTPNQQRYFEQRWTDAYREGIYQPPVLDANASVSGAIPPNRP